MGRGKMKNKPTGRRQFSMPEELVSGASMRSRTFKQKEEAEEEDKHQSEEESDEEPEAKRKGTQGIIEIKNPNMVVKPRNLKAKDVDVEKTTELSRREREEIEKKKAHERYMRLQEQGKTEQARKDLERLAIIRQQRAAAAQKREAEKAARELKKAEIRK